MRQKDAHTVSEPLLFNFSRSFTNEEQVSHFYSATANVKEILNYFRSKISLTLLGLHGMIKKQTLEPNTAGSHF